MRIRTLKSADIPQLRDIHERYYPDLDFPFDLALETECVIENDDGEILLAGGLELQAEALLVTDKSKNRVDLGRALVEVQRFFLYASGRLNARELYAFVTDDDYAKHLIQHGFDEREERVLRMKLYGKEENQPAQRTRRL
jgi:hypothetical protein